MTTTITKMSGAGNDFVVIDGETAAQIADFPNWVVKICRRGLSIGADGVLVVRCCDDGKVDVQFSNPDGSAAFCGNGTRCAARFAFERGMADQSMILNTTIGSVPAEITGERVAIELPAPRYCDSLELEAEDVQLRGEWIDAGTPQFVTFVPQVSEVPLARWGPVLRRRPEFGPAGCNVTFVEQRTEVLHIRTFEKGVEAETLACGSAAVAAAFVARRNGGSPRQQLVPRSGLPLEVQLLGDAASPAAAILAGDARFVFTGQLHTEATG